MNDRLKKLAIQSGQNLIPFMFPFMDERVKDMIFEEFAELIVQECSDIINHRAETSADYFDDIKVNDHARQVQRDCAQTLRLSFGLETFGVKE
jgi:hypothetical protein